MSADQSKHQHVDAETLQAIKTRYQTEYMLRAKSKLGFWNAFRGQDGRLKKLESIAARLMDKDIANGTLTARLKQDLAQEQADKRAAQNQPAAALPSDISYTDMTQELFEDQQRQTRRKPEPENYNVNIPDVARLQQIDDTGFLFFVLESLDPFDLSSPGYVECPELKAIREKKIPAGYEKPPTFATIVTKQFAITPTGDVVRDEKLKNTLILMHSDTQEDLIKTGSTAIAYYNKYGKIPMRAREEFMLEQTKEALRSAGYEFTPRYENFCMNVLNHVAMQTLTFNPPAPQQPQKPQVNVTVTFNLPAGKQDKPATAAKPAKSKGKKAAAAPKPKKAS